MLHSLCVMLATVCCNHVCCTQPDLCWPLCVSCLSLCRVHGLSCVLAAGAKKLGATPVSDTFFDTVTLKVCVGGG